MKTNQIAWDKTNAASLTLTPAQTPVRNKMGHTRRVFRTDRADHQAMRMHSATGWPQSSAAEPTVR
jgi:hypothetical protein